MIRKSTLLESAKELQPVSSASAQEYSQKAEQLVAAINAIMLKRPDVENLVGKNNLEMMKDNHANHIRFIASILRNYDPDVFVDCVLWVFRAYRSHGFTSNYWAAQLNLWIIILKKNLTEESFNEILPYYEWMQINIPKFVQLSEERLEISNEFH